MARALPVTDLGNSRLTVDLQPVIILAVDKIMNRVGNKGPVINYRGGGGGAGGNEKLDVKILLAPPLRQHNYT